MCVYIYRVDVSKLTKPPTKMEKERKLMKVTWKWDHGVFNYLLGKIYEFSFSKKKKKGKQKRKQNSSFCFWFNMKKVRFTVLRQEDCYFVFRYNTNCHIDCLVVNMIFFFFIFFFLKKNYINNF